MPTPYRVTTYAGNGAFQTHGRYATFREALTAYAALADETRQLLNDDKRDEGTTGLTDEEFHAVCCLPVERAATDVELAVALEEVR